MNLGQKETILGDRHLGSNSAKRDGERPRQVEDRVRRGCLVGPKNIRNTLTRTEIAVRRCSMICLINCLAAEVELENVDQTYGATTVNGREDNVRDL